MRTASVAVGAALVLIMAAVVPTTAAANPTLGARLTPVPVVVELQPWVEVQNLSTVAVVVSLEFTDGPLDGWQLAAESFSLAPDELRRVAVTAGRDTVTIRATLRPSDALEGTETSVLVLETAARHQSLFERHGEQLGLALLLALCLLILSLAAVFRLQRRAS